MTTNTKIEWCEHTWNPVSGCDRVSSGCDHCYAEATELRWRGNFDVVLHPERMDYPLTKGAWKPGDRVFVNSMSDVFHDEIPTDYIAEMYAVMALAANRGLIFQVLTKRQARMNRLLNSGTFVRRVEQKVKDRRPDLPGCFELAWPLPNVWQGVSVESQRYADLRIPMLLSTPAAVRFVSAEPLLGPVDLRDVHHAGAGSQIDALRCEEPGEAAAAGDPIGDNVVDWVIVGGESGVSARPMYPGWAREIRDACVAAGTPFLFKQWGTWGIGEGTGARIVGDNGASYKLGEPFQDVRNGVIMYRAAKAEHGRLLDGVEWTQFPRVEAVP